MELFKHDSKIGFMAARKWTAALSILLFICSITSLFVYRLQWGLDFTGGTQISIAYEKPADLETIRAELMKAGFNDSSFRVQSYGSSKDVVISIAPQKNMDQNHLVEKVMHVLPGATQQQVEFVGPEVGQELATKGLKAILIALFAILIYIAVRFEYRLGVSAVVALVHDPILILGIFSFFQITFDLKALAALLAVIGYSLNDTIVVFDRVRENFRKVRKATPTEIINLSINQTLSRTIMTSVLTFIVVAVLYVYGGESMRGFSLALIIGIVVGTYSSIYVAGALALALGLDRKDLLPAEKKPVDDRP
ncbi:MAG: protein translocase subunit SecF [Proteobacteria bacterium]|nr:protein translocase subunit SecF [Pseudomonadota bacterium]